MDAASSFGIGEPLSNPPEAKVDIVFVHDLGGHRINTWTFEQHKRIPSTFWPKALLRKTCNTSRILSFGYNSSFESFFPPSTDDKKIDDHATALLQCLEQLRSNTQTLGRPIIFVAHGLGGLVCAHALTDKHVANRSQYKPLVDSTRGLVFLGTPFEGSNEAQWASVARHFVKLTGLNTKLDHLDKRSQKLISINGTFIKFLLERLRSTAPVEIACFNEGLPTYFEDGSSKEIVSKSSAKILNIEPQPISADHTDMCKFWNASQDGYTRITKVLGDWIKALEPRSAKDNAKQPSVEMGAVYYSGEIRNNRGVLAGNVLGTTSDAVKITGSSYTFGPTTNAADVMRALDE
ncbi:ribonuclease p/mrp subunit, putative [Talaromyces stipitatus ATCC 10500]|uniref:Ribonuclease p/mrp subunit, putative n=1 Tax=Talaromyces stipitatus (strain ATCC 10500 / CBS 375.48 / QM 6759 / NRRL 1006) TaxID=441959 RepID=B8MSK3_TALSN|nr:ribonuclease p/mrp subunit, putative [Talaromyces stipitatus ATCC 10500]EED12083.1 ribonuclease p/mrp subunit, putative [Talaromyces stipitatus ATCC 10500]